MLRKLRCNMLVETRFKSRLIFFFNYHMTDLKSFDKLHKVFQCFTWSANLDMTAQYWLVIVASIVVRTAMPGKKEKLSIDI